MTFSTVLSGATIVDGTGAAPFVSDVAIADDRIALIGDCDAAGARERIDCRGMILSPGFIDVHAHSDELWLALPRCDGKIAQGVTTEIGGNCGTSVAPLYGTSALENARRSAAHLGIDVTWRSLDEFLTLVERNHTALNVATLAGLGTTRSAIAGDSERKLDRSEIAAQAALVREACEQGAIGVSSGLIYPPSSYADVGELAAMAAAAREGGAPIYATHVRDEGDGVVEAIAEALDVGRRAEVTVQCSHHKASGKRNWGKVHQTLGMIERARSGGLPAYCDVYPYTASWTDLAVILPPDVRFGGTQATLARLRDPESATAIALSLALSQGGLWHDIMITETGNERHAELAGLRVDEIAAKWGIAPQAAAIRLLIEAELEVGAIFFKMSEDDVKSVLSADFCCIGSDASARALSGPTARGAPHPRTFGTFPRILGRFVRELGVLDVPEAVRRMTSLPAEIFGLRDRGRIARGKYADLVVFDERAIRDTVTYEKPFSFPAGIDSVFVNGRAVVRRGSFTNELPGRVLRNGR